MKSALALLCAAAVLSAQTVPSPPEPPYKLVILRGEGAQSNLKKGRATKEVVEVRDRNDKPVGGVLLTFTLPRNGAGGTFVDGGQVTTVTTNNAGQATVTFQPNGVAGSYNIEVSGNVNGQPVNGQIAQANVAAAGMSGAMVGVIVAVAAGAAVGLGVALAGGSNNGSSGGPAPQPGLRVGVGTPTILPPR